jgi:hypothetical protein
MICFALRTLHLRGGQIRFIFHGWVGGWRGEIRDNDMLWMWGERWGGWKYEVGKWLMSVEGREKEGAEEEEEEFQHV